MPHSARTFRIFVSSTFSDLKEERNILATEVFPKLKELCEEHGARFQAIDLRWGVSDEASIDQRTLPICLEEILRCQKTGLRPNFIVLLGDRYGWRPPPPTIPATEFNEILAQTSDEEKKFLKVWYELDDNAVPSEYYLKCRTGPYIDIDTWSATERELLTILMRAAETLPLDTTQSVRYGGSATEQEIILGALGVPDAADHVFCFFRTIRNLPQDETSMAFYDPVDPFSNLRPDSEARARLDDLKGRLRKKISTRGQIFEYKTTWSKEGPVYDHPDRFARDVFESLSKAIKNQLSTIEAEDLDPIGQEYNAHLSFAKERAKFFTGRAECLEKIEDDTSSNNTYPLVLYGEPGSGKSAVMARVALNLQGSSRKIGVIHRHIGATPRSSVIRSLLAGLCGEIARLYGSYESVPSDYQELIQELPNRLALATIEKPLVIFLDGLDQLADVEARNLGWMPIQLPNNVHLIVSALPGQCLTSLQVRLPRERFLELQPMSKKEGEVLLALWLDDSRRRLREHQCTEILTKFAAVGLPLYLKLAYEEARLWHSFAPLTSTILACDVPHLIKDNLFARLAAASNHGELNVSHTLGYLAAARYGLTEDEVLDLLSRDEKLYRDLQVHAHHDLPETNPEKQRIPVIIWSRIFFDLEPYLSEQMAEDGVLLAFYHEQFRDAVMETWLNTDLRFQVVHSQLADYFRKKADPNNNQIWQKNARLLGELPFHLALGARKTEFHSLFSQLSYLSARVATGNIYELTTDYSLFGNSPDLILTLWHDFLQKHAQRLSNHHSMLVALVNHEGFSEARAQIDIVPWKQPWLRTSPEQMPKRGLKDEEGLSLQVMGSLEFHRDTVSAIAPQKNIAFCLEHLGSIRIYDLNTMRKTDATLSIKRDRPLVIACAPDATSIVILYESGSAELYRCFFGEKNWPERLELVTEFNFLLPEVEDPVVVWQKGAYWYQNTPGNIASISVDFPLVNNETQPFGDLGEISAIVFTEGTRLIACRHGSNTTLIARNVPSLEYRSIYVTSMCGCGADNVAVAFTDGSIVLFKLNDAIESIAEFHAGMVAGNLGWDGSRVIWMDRRRDFFAWCISEILPLPIQENHEILPDTLFSLPQEWHIQPDGSVLLRMTHGMFSFKLKENGNTRVDRVEELFGGSIWRAVIKRGDDRWLFEKQPLREVLLERDVRGRLYCAPDSKGCFFIVNSSGLGAVIDLVSLRSMTMQGCQPGLNTAIGEETGGCWFLNRVGNIFYSDATGECRCVATIDLPGVSGSHLYNCGDHIIWEGYSSKYYSTTGSEPARTFVFFKKSEGNPPIINQIGEQIRHPSEGQCLAVCYDQANRRIVTLWGEKNNGIDTYLLRIASVTEFTRWRFQEIDITGIGPFEINQTALSADGRFLGLLNRAGEMICVSITDGQVLATLSTSSPFTAVVSGARGSEFWLTEDRTRIYQLILVIGET